MKDDTVKRAVAMGERNREVMQLCQNWCSHIRIERDSIMGVGLIEQMTGLPVSGGYLACKFAKEPSMTGMDLESLAVEFVTSHCQQCDKRIPVRMPNIDELVVQRSRARNTAEDVQRREEGDARTAAAYRTELRLSLRNGASRFVVAALEILDEMDAEPVPGDGRLLSLAKTEPSSFTDPVVSALITFGMTNADRASLALPVLDILSIYTKDTASIALLASNAENELRTKHISTVATTTNLDDQQIDSAVSLLINMVAPFSWPHPTPLGDPSRFIEFFDRYPDRVKFRIRVLLQGDQPLRGMAAKALALLARHRDQLIEWSLPELARAWYLTSDQFDPSTAPVRWALADLLVHHPVKADEAIDKTRTRSTPDLSSDWLKVYYAALHRVEYDDTTRAAPELPIVATKRLFSELEKPPSEEDLRTLTELLRWMRDHHIGVLAPSHMRLLGIALRLSDAINELESSGRLWGKQLVGLNLENATHAVQQLCADVLKATARAAAETGASAVVNLCESLTAAANRDEGFAAMGIRSLKGIAHHPECRGPLLFTAYTSMANSNHVIRAAGGEIYGALLSHMKSGIPLLLHDLALIQLFDPYVIVHRGAVTAVRFDQLPLEARPRAANLILNLAAVYSRSPDLQHSEFISSLQRCSPPLIGLALCVLPCDLA